MLNIVDAELIEGNYVLYQGDLSTKVLEKLKGLGRFGGANPHACGRALENK
jgi:hypothetical protein